MCALWSWGVTCLVEIMMHPYAKAAGFADLCRKGSLHLINHNA